MSGVFISYSRRDEAFVRRLHAALAQRGRDVWVDWEDIPPSATWWDEVKSAIESADAVVFVVSPDSAASKVCREEVDHAAAHAKRMIPVVCRDTPAQTVPEALRARNFIFAREGDAFERAVEDLLRAIDTDLGWVRTHTRLLARALEWQARGRDASLLLRGRDLEDAEGQLASGAQRDPPPTQLQAEYVVAARRMATRGQRRQLAFVSVALAVAVALGVFALTQREEAVRQAAEAVQQRSLANAQALEADRQREQAVSEKDRADEQARTAQSRALAAAALSELPFDPEVSVLLAREAVQVSPTSQAELALRRAVAEARRYVPLVIGQRAAALGLSPDGSRLAVVGTSTTRIVDAATGAQQLELATGEGMEGIGWEPDGRRLATFGVDGRTLVWDASSGVLQREHQRGAGTVAAVAFDPAGDALVTGTHDGELTRWELSSGREIVTEDFGESDAARTISQDASLVAVVTANVGEVQVWDSRSDTVVRRFEGLSHIVDLAFSPDGRLLAGGRVNGELVIWDLVEGVERATLEGHSLGIDSVEFDQTGSRIVTAGPDGTVRVWDAAIGRLERALAGHSERVFSAVFNGDGTTISTASVDRSARLFSVETGTQTDIFRGHGDAVIEAVVGAGGATVATRAGDGTARLWLATSSRSTLIRTEVDVPISAIAPGGRFVAIGDQEVLQLWDVSGASEGPRSLAGVPQGRLELGFSLDGTRLAVAAQPSDATPTARVVLVYDTASGERIGRLETAADVSRLAYVPTGHLAVGMAGGAIELFDAALARIATLDLATDRAATGISASADGRRLIAWSADVARTFDGGSWQQLWEWRAPAGTFLDGAWLVADGSQAVISAPGPVISVRDAATGVELRSFALAERESVALPPLGRKLVTVDFDQTARVWDLDSGERTLVLRGHVSDIVLATASPDGDPLLTVGLDGTAIFWELQSGASLGRVAVAPGPGLAAWDAGGRRVVIVDGQGTIQVHDCVVCGPLDELLDRAGTVVSRALTQEERRRYGVEGG